MTTYFTYQITNEEPLKMGSVTSYTDTEYSLGYIAGSTLRGALVREWTKARGINDLDDDAHLKSLLLKGKIRVLNAYPSPNGKRMIPLAKCFFADKTEERAYDKTGFLNVQNELQKSTVIKESMVKASLGEFCSYEQGDIYTASAKKKFQLHISKQSEDNQIYRYEALEAGQTFTGVLAVDDADEKDADELKALLSKTVYLGGGKGSGYGRCHLTFTGETAVNPERFDVEDGQESGVFYVYVMSDMIARDELGRHAAIVPESYLTEKLNLASVSFCQSSMQPQMSAGFNVKWGTRMPSSFCIKAGSVMKYTYEGKLDDERIQQLEHQGFGDRLQDGYGRFLILRHFGGSRMKPAEMTGQTPVAGVEMDESDKKEAKKILKRIFIKKVEDSFDKRIIEKEEKYRTNLAMINHSQLGKLVDLLHQGKSQPADTGRIVIKRYLAHLHDKQDQPAYKQLTATKMDGFKLFAFLSEYIDQVTNADALMQDLPEEMRTFAIDGMKPELNEEDIYQLNMNYLEKRLRYLLRIKEEMQHESK